ncbi:nitronate monooxygenase [Kiloniella laminariae]|uniref:Nitronate monooxygenase n=1 Tax=Kiloniella laminariae TaxID=454162 RepID=A0ABT4LSK1_9PROT|nr:nitronate monooxygenase [Kiloniella laminariae]MCZ4282912.1 nitronate monooxygenase [Kiloniella laminariae]
MSETVFKTRLTDLLGIRYPVLCGGLLHLADANYVAAVVNAGAMGFISALTFPDPEQLRDEIRKCRELTSGKPFGVNLYISARPDANDRLIPLVSVVREEKVAVVETAGGSPAAIVPLMKEAGIKVIHKAPAIRFALSAEKAGVDAVILVGAEGGGHPGYMMVGTMVQGAIGPERLSIPVILGGGIGHGSQLTAALAMGCEGILMGTRMLVSEEIGAHRAYKQRIVSGDGLDSLVVMTSFKNHHRVLHNEAAEAVAALEKSGSQDYADYADLISGKRAREAYATGDTSQGMLDYGQSACFANEIEPVVTIIDRFMQEAALGLKRIGI